MTIYRDPVSGDLTRKAPDGIVCDWPIAHTQGDGEPVVCGNPAVRYYSITALTFLVNLHTTSVTNSQAARCSQHPMGPSKFSGTTNNREISENEYLVLQVMND